MSDVVGRFAPSPSGRMHLGNLWACLLAWLAARSAGGRMVLRLEDLDPDRCRPEYCDQILRDLEWLGLDWDGAPVYQSRRTEAYAAAFQALANQGLLYPCFCTRAQRLAASAPHRSDGEAIYDGRCRRLSEAERRDLAAAARDISAGSERLDAYIRLLIDASRGAGDASREPIRPADLCEQIVREARATTHARGIEADIDIESAIGTLPEVPLDRVALVRAAMNLVSNAAEHARGRIGIACALSGNTLTICVTDDGPGFSPAALEHGCERLFTDDSARSTRDGEQHYGLGLYTAAETVRAHGGDLVLANLPDGGASAALSISLAGMKEGPFSKKSGLWTPKRTGSASTTFLSAKTRGQKRRLSGPGA